MGGVLLVDVLDVLWVVLSPVNRVRAAEGPLVARFDVDGELGAHRVPAACVREVLLEGVLVEEVHPDVVVVVVVQREVDVDTFRDLAAPAAFDGDDRFGVQSAEAEDLLFDGGGSDGPGEGRPERAMAFGAPGHSCARL